MAREPINNIAVEAPARPVHEAIEDVMTTGRIGEPSASLDTDMDDVVNRIREDTLAGIHYTVRNIPKSRHEEMFKDFEEAIQSRKIGYLADTIANWAQGGHGYDHAGVVVNRALDGLPPLTDDPELMQVWQEYLTAREAEERSAHV